MFSDAEQIIKKRFDDEMNFTEMIHDFMMIVDEIF
jgi:hypothetical protein